MASKIDLSGLNNFRQKLQNYANMNSFADRLVNAILEKGRDIALEEYAGIKDVDIFTEKNGQVGKIIAKGEQIAYIEFGTGAYAEGTYKGKLPTENVPKTNKWSYYYPSIYKQTVDGEEGWFTKQKTGELTFEIGQEAGNQMYRVSKRLREALPSIIEQCRSGK